MINLTRQILSLSAELTESRSHPASPIMSSLQSGLVMQGKKFRGYFPSSTFRLIMTPEESPTALQMNHRKPTGATNPLAKSRVRKAIPRTPAAQWNRTMLKELQTVLDRNPEVDLQSCFKPTYLDKLTMLKSPRNTLFKALQLAMSLQLMPTTLSSSSSSTSKR